METAKDLNFIPLKRILLVENNPARRRLLIQNLEAYTGAEVIYLPNAERIIEYLHQDHECDLIVCENQVDDENTALKIYYTVNSQKLKIPIILMGQNPKIQNEVTCVEKENWKSIIKNAAKAMGITAESMAEWEAPEYYPFMIYNLCGLSKSQYTLYLEDRKTREIKAWKKPGDELPHSEIQDCLSQGHHFFYIHNKERLKFTDLLSEHIQQQLEDQDTPLEQRIGSTSTALRNTLNIFKEKGITEEGLDVCKQAVDDTMKMASQTLDLELFLENLMKESDTSFYQHSLLISILACQCLNHLPTENLEQDQKRICYAAFFHDAFVCNHELYEIQTMEELESAELSEKTKQNVLEHASRMAKLIEKHPSLPYEVDKIVLCHHGDNQGTSLPLEGDPIPTDIPNLAQLFMICEMFAHESLKVAGETEAAFNRVNQIQADDGQKQMISALKKVIE